MSGPSKPILVITNSCERAGALVSILALGDWPCHCVSNCRDGLDYLGASPTRLVLCESRLSDGTWRIVLDALQAMRDAPQLVVFSSHADEALWAEVLNLGGYDVLMSPFDRNELQRTVASALRRSGEISVN